MLEITLDIIPVQLQALLKDGEPDIGMPIFVKQPNGKLEQLEITKEFTKERLQVGCSRDLIYKVINIRTNDFSSNSN